MLGGQLMAVTGKGAEGLDTAARAMAAEQAEHARRQQREATQSSPAGAEAPPLVSRADRAPSTDTV